MVFFKFLLPFKSKLKSISLKSRENMQQEVEAVLSSQLWEWFVQCQGQDLNPDLTLKSVPSRKCAKESCFQRHIITRRPWPHSTHTHWGKLPGSSVLLHSDSFFFSVPLFERNSTGKTLQISVLTYWGKLKEVKYLNKTIHPVPHCRWMTQFT